MQLVRRFSLNFPQTSAENQYQQIKADQLRTFFKLILVLLSCVCLYGVIQSAINSNYEYIGPLGLLLVASILIFIYNRKFRRFAHLLLFAICLGFSSLAFVIFRLEIVPSACYPALFRGYIFGSFERIVDQRLPGIKLKILLSLTLYILRCSLFPTDNISIHIFHTLVSILNLVVEYWKEREDRRLFHDLYDYKQSLIKFKSLLVSGFNTNIFILSKDLSQILFKNEHPLDPNSPLRPSTLRDQSKLYEWLNQLILNKDLFNEGSKSAFSKNDQSQEMTVLKTLKTLSTEDFLNNQQKFSFNAEFQRDSTDKRVFEVKVFGLVWDKRDAMAVILNDVTEHYQNLNLKVADYNKDKMLAMISHELKTPLNGILSVVNALEKEIHQPHLLSFIKVCRNSGELLLNLVNSILDLRHIRDHKFVLRPTRDNLHDLLNGIFSLFKLQFDQKCLYLHLDIAPDVPLEIVTDQNRLRQVLINLIGNAFKFTFQGGVTISAQVDPIQEGYIQFRVADTGIGICQEDQKKLFKMYGRLDQPHPGINHQGTGFGLEISDQLARLLADNMEDGGIKLESEEGVGSVFSFSVKDDGMDEHQDLECSYQSHGLHFHEPKVFEEDIEDISIKLSPYSSGFGTTDRLMSPKLSELACGGNFDFSRGSISSRAFLRSASSSPRKGNGDAAKSLFNIKNKKKLRLPLPTETGATAFYIKQQPSIARSITNKSLKSNRSNKSKTNQSIRSDKSKKEGGYSDGSFNSSLHKSKKIETRIETEEKINILVVDDNTFNLMVAEHLVLNWGYTVKTALNGKLAIQEVLKANETQNKIHAILMDLQMPIMDGYEATRELRLMMERGEIPEIPIIAVSANDSEDDKRRCQEVGMYGHLSKPLYEDNLKEVLDRALNKEIKEGIAGENSYMTGEENVHN